MTSLAATASPASLGDAFRAFARAPSPRCLVLFAGFAGGARFFLGPPGLADLAALGALLLFWPLQEWLIHVLILHYRPRHVFGHVLDFEIPRKHRAHHRSPWQQDLVFIPMRAFVYAPLVVGAAFWLLPHPAALATGVAAYFGLSLQYEWVHFLVHTRHVPRSAWYRRLWRNHRLHHFKSEHYWFGVTMLSGDTILRTGPDPGEVSHSPTARRLHEAAPDAGTI